MGNSEYTKIKERKTGRIHYLKRSDLYGGCFHIYANDLYSDNWMYNIYSENEFSERFEVIGKNLDNVVIKHVPACTY